MNARGIIPRDDKLQTSYEGPLDQRAEFYALKRSPRDARGARARSVLKIRLNGYPSTVIGTSCSTDHHNERTSTADTTAVNIYDHHHKNERKTVVHIHDHPLASFFFVRCENARRRFVPQQPKTRLCLRDERPACICSHRRSSGRKTRVHCLSTNRDKTTRVLL